MRIMSWNIQWGRGADGRVDLERTIAAIEAVGELDVICLQEVSQHFVGLAGGHGEDEVAILSAAFPGHEPAYAPALDLAMGPARGRFGNLILARPPVEQIFRHLLPCPVDPSVPAMQRSCAEVVLRGATGVVRVLTTHLEYYSALQRRAQIAALRALHLEVAENAARPGAAKESNPAFARRPRPVAAILCGDFNCEVGSDDYLAMGAPFGNAAAGWADAWTIAHPGRPHDPTVGLHGADWPDRAYCCDFFWVTHELAPHVRTLAVEAETPASDHQPVILDILV